MVQQCGRVKLGVAMMEVGVAAAIATKVNVGVAMVEVGGAKVNSLDS